MRRFVTLALSLTLLLGLTVAGRLAAQDEKKADGPAKPADAKPADAKPAEGQDPAKDQGAEAGKEAAKDDTPPPMQELTPPESIPPEVEQKLEAARKAVAEAIVAAQDAGLVDTTISPPPVLDILLLGRADDKATLAKVAGKSVEAGVSPEVFGAWFTGQGQLENVTSEKNVRIVPPSKGLKAYYDRRASLFTRYIDEARKAKGTPAPADTPQPADTPKEEAKPADTPKEEAKPADTPKEEAPKDEPKVEEPKPEEPKADAPKPEEPKAEEPKPEEPKAEEPKPEQPE